MTTQSQANTTLHRVVDFKKPPVVETALAFMFTPIKGWNLLHFGLLWSRYRSKYPHPEVKLPTGVPQLSDLDLKIGQDVDLRGLPLRCWFVDPSKHQLLQVQSNCFIRNWRALVGEPSTYVHYDEIRPLFQNDWITFRSFLASENLEFPKVIQSEVTYINHLVRGTDWESPADIGVIFPYYSRPISSVHEQQISGFGFGGSLAEGGQIQVNVQPGLRADGKQILQLTITVIKVPKTSTDNDLLEALDSGHSTLVQYFAEITSKPAQDKWERTL